MTILKKLILIALIIALFSCTQTKDAYVAKVKSEYILSNHFKNRFLSSTQFKNSKLVTTENIKKFIDEKFLPDVLFKLDAYNNELQKDKDISDYVQKKKVLFLTGSKSLLMNRIRKENSKVSNKEVKEYYNNLDIEVQLAHILVRGKKLADSLYNELRKDNSKFKQFVEEFTLDINSAHNGGMLARPVTRGLMPKTLEDVAFSLKNKEISHPIKTIYGYHILKKIFDQPFKNQPFEKIEKALLKKVANIKQSRAIEKFINQLIEENPINIDPLFMKEMVKNAQINFGIPKINKENISEELLQKVIYSDKYNTVNFETIIDIYNESKVNERIPATREDIALDLIHKTIIPFLKYKKALEYGDDNDPDFKIKVHNIESYKVSNLYKQKNINEKLVINQDSVLNYYNKNLNLYKNKEFKKIKNFLKGKVYLENRDKLEKRILEDLKKKYSIEYNEKQIEILKNEFNQLKQGKQKNKK